MKPFPGLSVLENVTVGALFGTGGGERNRKRAEEKAREWLQFTGLERRMDQRADALGGPDRKRLEFAKALSMNPKLLLLDEVMAGLRPTECDQLVAVFREINRAEGLTILLIEHVMRAVMALAAQVVVVSYGEKIAEGTPAEITRNQAVLDVYLGDEDAS